MEGQNKCVSCIKDTITGQCFDIKDKTAREQLTVIDESVEGIRTVAMQAQSRANANREKIIELENEIGTGDTGGSTKLYKHDLVLYGQIEDDPNASIELSIITTKTADEMTFEYLKQNLLLLKNQPGVFYTVTISGYCLITSAGVYEDTLQVETVDINGNYIMLEANSMEMVSTTEI